MSNPVDNFPDFFGGCPFLKHNPYFLPCFVSACVSLFGFVVGFFFLPETKNMSRKDGYQRVSSSEAEEPENLSNADSTPVNVDSESTIRIVSDDHGHDSDSDSDSDSGDDEMSSDIEKLKSTTTTSSRQIEFVAFAAICSYSLLAFQDIIIAETFTLWMVTPIIHGIFSFLWKHVDNNLLTFTTKF